MEIKQTIKTNGKGLWSSVKKTVLVTHIDIMNFSEGACELKAYFDTKTWNIKKDGLIYTDPAFITGLKKILKSKKINTRDLIYSEQGMQGTDYVSFDADERLIKSYYK